MKLQAYFLSVLLLLALCSDTKAQSLEDNEFSEIKIMCHAIVVEIDSFKTLAHVFQWTCRDDGGIPSLRLFPLENNRRLVRLPDLNEIEAAKFMTSFISDVLLEIDERTLYQRPILLLRVSSKLKDPERSQMELKLPQIRTILQKAKDLNLIKEYYYVDLISEENEALTTWISINYALLQDFSLLNKIPGGSLNTHSLIKIGKTNILTVQTLPAMNKLQSGQVLNIYGATFIIDQDVIANAGFDQARNYLLEQIKVSTENIAYCFNTLDNDSQYDMGFQFRGNFKAHKCLNQILSFIGNNYCTYSEEDVLIGDCSAFSPFKKIEKEAEVVAIDVAFYPKELLFGRDKGNSVSLKDFRTLIIEYCQRELPSLQLKFNKSLANQCIEGMFVSTILIDGFGLLEGNVLIPSSIPGYRIDWTTGSLLIQLAKSPCDFVEQEKCLS